MAFLPERMGRLSGLDNGLDGPALGKGIPGIAD